METHQQCLVCQLCAAMVGNRRPAKGQVPKRTEPDDLGFDPEYFDPDDFDPARFDPDNTDEDYI